MSFQTGNTQLAEATMPELELNKDTLHDLEVDGSQVKGGANVYVPVAGPAHVAPGTDRMTIGSGTSVIHQNPSGG